MTRRRRPRTRRRSPWRHAETTRPGPRRCRCHHAAGGGGSGQGLLEDDKRKQGRADRAGDALGDVDDAGRLPHGCWRQAPESGGHGRGNDGAQPETDEQQRQKRGWIGGVDADLGAPVAVPANADGYADRDDAAGADLVGQRAGHAERQRRAESLGYEQQTGIEGALVSDDPRSTTAGAGLLRTGGAGDEADRRPGGQAAVAEQGKVESSGSWVPAGRDGRRSRPARRRRSRATAPGGRLPGRGRRSRPGRRGTLGQPPGKQEEPYGHRDVVPDGGLRRATVGRRGGSPGHPLAG